MATEQGYEAARAAAIARGETASVKVYAPCSCAACASGRRWFYCQNAAHPVAEYLCAPRYVDSPDVPAIEALRAIEAEHPGCTFVYID